jgi:hypothetical protein
VNQISESDLSFQAALRTPPLTNLPSRQSFSRPAAATPCAQRPLDPNTTLTSFSQIACVHSRSLDLVQRVDFRDVSASDDQAFMLERLSNSSAIATTWRSWKSSELAWRTKTPKPPAFRSGICSMSSLRLRRCAIRNTYLLAPLSESLNCRPSCFAQGITSWKEKLDRQELELVANASKGR